MISPQTSFQLINQIIDRYSLAIDRVVATQIRPLADYLSAGGLDTKSRRLQQDFRGIFEPVARDLYERQLVLYLAALYLASQEDNTRLEFQSPNISAIFSVRPGEALAFFLGKKVVTRDEFDRLTPREQIRAFTVSRVAERRMLEAIKQEIARNIVEGKSHQELIKFLQATLPENARRYAGVIAHQNLRQAAMAGRFEQMWRSRRRYPYAQWKTMEDEKVREAHRALHNQIWPLEQMPFWPPLGFRCRCWVIQLGEHQLPAGQQVIRGPGVYSTADGDPLLVDRDNNYALPNRPLTFEFTNMPIRDRDALDIAREFRREIFQSGGFQDLPANDVDNYFKLLGRGFKSAEALERKRSLTNNEYFVYNGAKEPLYSDPPRPGEMWVDVHQYTQNEHFLTTFIEQALRNGLDNSQIELHFKGTAMGGYYYPDSQEILKDSLPKIGDISRSTEFVLRFRSSNQSILIQTAKDLLAAAEKHGPHTTTRRLTSEAWLESDIRIAGLPSTWDKITDAQLGKQWGLPASIYKRLWLAYRKLPGGGEIAKLYPEPPRSGWDGGYWVWINRRLADYVKPD